MGSVKLPGSHEIYVELIFGLSASVLSPQVV